MNGKNLDILLMQVISQARSLSVPVSRNIDPHVTVNTRARTRFGCCRSAKGRHTIEVSSTLLEAEEMFIKQVLAHEVLHTCPDCADHGQRWKHWAEQMNQAFGYDIRRTHTPQSLGLEDTRPARYLLVCRQCGKSIPRMKRSRLVDHPEHYRCKCGGTLFLTTPGTPCNPLKGGL